MTIFTEVSKHFLLLGIDRIIQSSTSHDEDLVNKSRQQLSKMTSSTIRGIASTLSEVSFIAQSVAKAVKQSPESKVIEIVEELSSSAHDGEPSDVVLQSRTDVAASVIESSEAQSMVTTLELAGAVKQEEQEEAPLNKGGAELAMPPVLSTVENKEAGVTTKTAAKKAAKAKKKAATEAAAIESMPAGYIDSSYQEHAVAQPSIESSKLARTLAIDEAEAFSINREMAAAQIIPVTSPRMKEEDLVVINFKPNENLGETSSSGNPSMVSSAVGIVSSSVAKVMRQLSDGVFSASSSIGEGGRNLELSAKKREKLEALKIKIRDLVATDDLHAMNTLTQYLNETLEDLKNTARGYGYAPRATEDAVTGLITLQQQIQRKIDVLTWLDKPHDEEPIDIMKYYTALNAARLLFDEHYAKRELQPSALIELKEQLLQEQLQAYLTNVKRLDINHPEYLRGKADLATTFIQSMKDRAKPLDQQYFYSFSNVAHQFYQDKLSEYLDQAAAIISKRWLEQVDETHEEGDTLVISRHQGHK